MGKDKYYGSDPNEIRLLISSDIDTNSETIIASTKCVYDALNGIKSIRVPEQEGQEGKQLFTDGLKLYWGEEPHNLWKSTKNYVEDEHVVIEDGTDYFCVKACGPGVPNQIGGGLCWSQIS